MAQYFKDAHGNLVGTVKSSEEIEAEGAVALMLMVAGGAVALVIAPFVPILAAGYWAFQWLRTSAGWHELFAGAVGLFVVVSALFIIVKFVAVRWLYFGSAACAAVIYSWLNIYRASDYIWATFFGLILAGVAVFVTQWIVRHEFWDDPWGYVT